MSTRRGNGEGTISPHRLGFHGQVRVTDPTSGKTKRVSVYGRTRTEVRAKLRETIRRAGAGGALRDGRETVEAFLDRWTQTTLAASSRRATTQQTYRTLVRSQLVPRLGNLRLDQVRPSNVDELVLGMRVDGKAAGTIRQTYTILRLALDDAVRDGRLIRNPAALVDRPRIGRYDAQVLTVDQVRQVLAAAEGHRLRPILAVLASTGLRRGEALALRWQDVDLDAGQARVVGGLVRVGKQLVIQPPKTDRGRRTVPLAPAVVVELKAHRKAQLGERLAAGPAWSDRGMVFTTELGTPLDPRNVLRWYQTLAGTVSVPGGLHTLRHTAATMLLAQGASLRLVADVLGHSSVQITGDVYAHVLDEQRREAVDGLGAALGL